MILYINASPKLDKSNSEYFISEFAHWVEERKTIGLDYLSFISSLLKLNNNQEIIAGVGKGEVNTLSTNINDKNLFSFFTKDKDNAMAKNIIDVIPIVYALYSILFKSTVGVSIL